MARAVLFLRLAMHPSDSAYFPIDPVRTEKVLRVHHIDTLPCIETLLSLPLPGPEHLLLREQQTRKRHLIKAHPGSPPLRSARWRDYRRQRSRRGPRDDGGTSTARRRFGLQECYELREKARILGVGLGSPSACKK